MGGISVTFYHVVIVTFVHVNEDDDVVFFDDPGNGSVRVEQTAQLMAPPSPVGSELENDALVFRGGGLDRNFDLLGAVRSRIVKRGLLGLGGNVCRQGRDWADESKERSANKQVKRGFEKGTHIPNFTS